MHIPKITGLKTRVGILATAGTVLFATAPSIAKAQKADTFEKTTKFEQVDSLAFPSAKGSDSAKFLVNAPSPKVTVTGEKNWLQLLWIWQKIFCITIMKMAKRYLLIELQVGKQAVILKQGLELLAMLKLSHIIPHQKRPNAAKHLGVMDQRLFAWKNLIHQQVKKV